MGSQPPALTGVPSSAARNQGGQKGGRRGYTHPTAPLQLPGKQSSAPEHFGHGLEAVRDRRQRSPVGKIPLSERLEEMERSWCDHLLTCQ